MFEVSQTEGWEGSEESAITRKLGSAWSSIIESSVIMHLDCTMVYSATQVQRDTPSYDSNSLPCPPI